MNDLKNFMIENYNKVYNEIEKYKIENKKNLKYKFYYNYLFENKIIIIIKKRNYNLYKKDYEKIFNDIEKYKIIKHNKENKIIYEIYLRNLLI